MNKELINLRESLGYSQSAFAEELGISGAFLCLLEQGKRMPSHGTIMGIKKIVNKNSACEFTLGEIIDKFFNPPLEIIEKSDII